MADAIDVVADVLALVRERDEARECRDVSQREADSVLAAMRESARQVEMLRAERDKAIEERDLARCGFDLRREEADRAQALYAASTTELANLRSRIVEHEASDRAVGARAERERLRAIAAAITAPEDAVAFIEDLKRGDL